MSVLTFTMRHKAIGLLQANLNHARQAQDLFVHILAEYDCGLGLQSPIGFLGRVIDTLFPRTGESYGMPPGAPFPGWCEDEFRVTPPEFRKAIRKIKRHKIPGPGVPDLVLAVVAGELPEDIECMFTDCLRSGQFPTAWKEVCLVLLCKEDKSTDDLSAFRPICWQVVGKDNRGTLRLAPVMGPRIGFRCTAVRRREIYDRCNLACSLPLGGHREGGGWHWRCSWTLPVPLTPSSGLKSGGRWFNTLPTFVR